MRERDPRTQLYSVATDCLKKLEADFHTSALAQTFAWMQFFKQTAEYMTQFDFADSDSSIATDSALLLGLFARSEQEVYISLRLFKNGEVYCRDQDKQTGLRDGLYDVYLAPVIPPTLLPAGMYDEIEKTPADLYIFSRSGIGEVVGAGRCSSLITVLSTLAIEQLDTSDFEFLD